MFKRRSHGRVGEGEKQIESFLLVFEHALPGIVDAAAVVHFFDNIIHLIGIVVVALHHVDYLTLFAFWAVAEHLYQWQRHFLFFDVDTVGFSGGNIGGIVEEVVFDLESNAHVFADTIHLLNCFSIGAGGLCSGSAAGGDERSRFFANDLKINLLLDVQAARLFYLQQLPLAHFARCRRDDS